MSVLYLFIFELNKSKADVSKNKKPTDIVHAKNLCTRQISQNPYPIRVLPS